MPGNKEEDIEALKLSENVEIKHHKDYSSGPERNRSITDCLFCLLMLGFWAFCAWLAVYSIQNGNLDRLGMVMDIDSVPCGIEENGTADYPYGYIYQPLNSLSEAVCLSSCPQWINDEDRPTQLDCYMVGDRKQSEVNNCIQEQQFKFSYLPDQYFTFSDEPFLIYNTTALLGRICMISSLSTEEISSAWFSNMTIATQTVDVLTEYMDDIVTVKWQLLYIAIISFVVCIIAMFIIRYVAGFFVWIQILLFVGCLYAIAGFSLTESNRLSDLATQEGYETTENNTYYTATNLYYASISFFIIAGIVTLILLFNLGTIALSIAIIKSAALFVGQTFWIVLLPIFFAVLVLVYFGFWLLVLAYLWTIGTVTSGSATPFVSIDWDTQNIYLIIAHFFAVLWNIAFLNYLMIFIIACSCVIWYYNNKDSPNYFPRPILTATYWSFRYHLGSIALGAFILALIWAVQIVLAYVAKKVNDLKKNGVESKVLEYTVKCLMIIVACFERIVKFISKLGFIKVAVSSENFCTSCFKAMTLLISNPMKFGIIYALGGIFTLLGKLFISALAGVIGYLFLYYDEELTSELSTQFIPVIIFIIIGYLISALFFMIYGISSDTIIICFFQDRDMAGKEGRAVHAPAPMSAFYEKFKK